ncbi:hypothetical protein ABZS83_30645 [Streptomyces sp. NPDC005426]|uniref:hypothetical protein n=1 Tax=Streptomyces sp. NPDC005426 TaxID=3155344 RepID=UPI0033A6BC5E
MTAGAAFVGNILDNTLRTPSVVSADAEPVGESTTEAPAPDDQPDTKATAPLDETAGPAEGQ